MADVYCNNCGHKNPLGSNFCSSCGQALELDPGEHTTITFAVDAGETADEELTFDLDEIPAGAGMLVVTRGPIAGSRFAVTKKLTTLGRHPDSDIFLDDITVSRRHAELAREGDQFTVRDVGSLNGTYLNRQRMEKAAMHNGDELQVGKFKLVFFAGSGERES
ncbi:MAG: FHA domain-containing protein [Acidimicrobiales bacterium]